MNAQGTLNPLRAWNQFWFASTSARPLGAFRVVFGLLVLAHLALLWPDASLFLSDAGYLVGSEARELAGPLRWSPLQYIQNPSIVHIFMAIAALSAVFYTIGWHTRLVGVVLYATLLTLHHRNILTLSGADSLLMVTAFWMMLSPAGAAYSWDARKVARERGTPAEPLIAPWTQRVIQFQLCVVYFVTAVEKCRGASWTDGTALYYVLSNRELARWTFGLTEHLTLINALTFAALGLEFALAFLLWFRPTRGWVALCGLVLHVGIMLTVNIPIFGELMMATYLLFLTPAELRTFLRAVSPWTWRGRISATRASIPAPHGVLNGRNRQPAVSARA